MCWWHLPNKKQADFLEHVSQKGESVPIQTNFHQTHSSCGQWPLPHEKALSISEVKNPVSYPHFPSFPFPCLFGHPRIFLSISNWYFRLTQLSSVVPSGQQIELDPDARVTHLPQPLLQVLNRHCPGCFWLHIDTVLHLLSEHCGSSNSLNQEQQCVHSPARERRAQGENFVYTLHTSSTKRPLAKLGLTCIKLISAAL